MPPKKRKPSVSSEHSEDIPQTKRRRKPVQYDPVEICQELYETIRSHRNEDGRILCEAFIRVPKRRSDPEYYTTVNQPIDLLKIKDKLKNDEYEDIDQLTSDVELMLNNAKAYYKKASQEYNDASDLWTIYQDKKSTLLAEAFGDIIPDTTQQDVPLVAAECEEEPALEDPSDHVPSPVVTGDENTEEESMSRQGEDFTQYEDLFSAVYSAKEGGREISEMFRVLPSRTKLPDYYRIIKEPMDLKTIAIKLQNYEYLSLEDMVKDLIKMVQNAKAFNEPGSLIYKDSTTLRKVIMNKKAELDKIRDTGIGPVKTSKRIRSRRSAAGVKRLSEICAAIKSNDDEEEGEFPIPAPVAVELPMMEYEEESGTEGSVITDIEDNAQWILFNTVRQYRNSYGQQISDPFMKLPNKRVYPDYYEEIDKPISMLNIQKNIKVGKYTTLDELVVDMDLMLENAKRFNIEESQIHKDAIKLQSLMWSKKRELDGEKEEELKDISDIYIRSMGGTPKVRRSIDPSPSRASDDGSGKKKKKEKSTDCDSA